MSGAPRANALRAAIGDRADTTDSPAAAFEQLSSGRAGRGARGLDGVPAPRGGRARQREEAAPPPLRAPRVPRAAPLHDRYETAATDRDPPRPGVLLAGREAGGQLEHRAPLSPSLPRRAPTTPCRRQRARRHRYVLKDGARGCRRDAALLKEEATPREGKRGRLSPPARQTREITRGTPWHASWMALRSTGVEVKEGEGRQRETGNRGGSSARATGAATSACTSSPRRSADSLPWRATGRCMPRSAT